MTYRDGDVVTVRATVKTVREKQRLQFKGGKPTLELKDAEIVQIAQPTFKPGDVVDIAIPGEMIERGVVTEVGDMLKVFMNGGNLTEVNPQYASRCD